MSCGCGSPAPVPAGQEDAGCSGGESFALRVLGDDMAPEFNEGDIIIVEPDGALKDGSFVLAQHGGEWTFRQLAQRGGGWWLHALNPARTDLADLPLPGLQAVHGVVSQKAVPGRRKLTRHYI
jgi:phage repressor protein C with HTH and peptisase S24 domain